MLYWVATVSARIIIYSSSLYMAAFLKVAIEAYAFQFATVSFQCLSTYSQAIAKKDRYVYGF
ncbi:MAG: hypothetical protein P5702_16355 [Limnospira sp. PMC 1291.21]|uniref:Uncharacterized protein n=2 Tax=Limnospira TaxID=2596745 RepID=B5W918_LIMMA|nr:MULTISPECIES: hypothetical protein [Limnospira]QJB24382.1 hypothetical protein HFV01_07985 [Limnospira fusiformis SAG 85.79]UWU47631.1 hypothetical protein APLC1_2402 [Arthrospira platensis C1]EDZ91986.1 hypothetical protein AmaxDRAFT_5268 [Limnospira maxima CS-328]MDT9179089.1 hypothetical protein [Limnospira sp. PMC 1238.20]MDT9189336.1 hypothetical protein [Limnospira sp. PMC 894.15]